MFTLKEKQHLAEVIEKAILDLKHPEMPGERPKFKIHIEGKEDWSWADIEPNWTFENKQPGVNVFNELSRKIFPKKRGDTQ